MDEYSFDRLGWSNDKAILSIIGKEKIIYSNKVYKYNSLSLKNERYLLLTDKCLYNFKNKKVKREMQYQLMLGITYSVQSNEFVIHASEGFDFHFLSDEKLIIIYLIAKCYEMINNESIIICKVNDKSLKQFVISKKLKKKDFKNTKLNKKYIIDTRTFIADNPHIKLTIDCHSTYNTIHQLQDGNIDVGFICETTLPPDYIYEPYEEIHDTFIASESYLHNLYVREANVQNLNDHKNITNSNPFLMAGNVTGFLGNLNSSSTGYDSEEIRPPLHRMEHAGGRNGKSRGPGNGA